MLEGKTQDVGTCEYSPRNPSMLPSISKARADGASQQSCDRARAASAGSEEAPRIKSPLDRSSALVDCTIAKTYLLMAA